MEATFLRMLSLLHRTDVYYNNSTIIIYMSSPTEAIMPRTSCQMLRQYLPRQQDLPNRKSLLNRQSPDPTSRTPESTRHDFYRPRWPCPSDSWSMLLYIYPERAGIPGLGTDFTPPSDLTFTNTIRNGIHFLHTQDSKYQSNINSAYIICQVWITPFIGSYSKTRPSLSRTHSQLPDCLVSPLEAATGKGRNHSWQPTRQSRLPQTTVYDLFRVQYLPTAPNQYPKYNPRCTIATHMWWKDWFVTQGRVQ